MYVNVAGEWEEGKAERFYVQSSEYTIGLEAPGINAQPPECN